MQTQVTHVPDASRFDLLVDGERVGLLDYARDGDTWALTHTEVDPSLGGRGLGATLVLGALEAIDAEGGSVLPLCPFVPRVLRDHPEHLHLVPEAQRPRFGL
ncbi:GNAT family N-acetyltransferase [Solicola sp. PLA-1-18]|uniref:GNAT family N-acetyltransferase n=1 Tax=Solicola sp. PLA-1-18 TaxID=3380532 RepID=UPI003B798621